MNNTKMIMNEENEDEDVEDSDNEDEDETIYEILWTILRFL